MSTLPEMKNEIIISPETITNVQISQYFDIEVKELKQIFLELQWVKRKYFLWLKTTGLGEEKGAKKRNNEIIWNREIIGDKELIIAIKYYKNEEIDPALYQSQVQNKYKKEGYTIWDYSKEKGSYNKNIHFVAKKDKTVLLVHCTTGKTDIMIDEVVNFMESRKEFLIENPVFKIYKTNVQYTMPNFSINEDAFKYLKEHKKYIYYKIMK